MTGRGRGIGPVLAAGLVKAVAATALVAGVALFVSEAAAGATGDGPGGTAKADPPSFTEDERAAILAHGPWPPPRPRDPSNRLDGDPAAIELGRRLFFDPRLSGDGSRSCATCHDPARGWQDGRAVGIGAAPLRRNTMAVTDLAFQRWFGWDGAHDSLWAASLKPLADPAEMAATPESLAALVRSDPDLAGRWRALFGAEPRPEPGTLVDAAKALAAFQATLITPPTRFDAYRDALAAGDPTGGDHLDAAEIRGLRLFVGEARCALCHAGPAFTNGEFADIGMPFFEPVPFGSKRSERKEPARAGESGAIPDRSDDSIRSGNALVPGGVDPGRHGGIRALAASPTTRLGSYSDIPGDKARSPDTVATRRVVLEHRNFGEFKVPTLRGAARTGPYMHAGTLPTLDAVVRRYSELDEDRVHADGERILRALRLDDAGIADLVAFLRALSDPVR